MQPGFFTMNTPSSDSTTTRTVAQARDQVLARIVPIAAREQVFVQQALGRVLAENIRAPLNVPAHDNSAMDGYALRHADLAPEREVRLTVVGRALAGHPFSRPLAAGEAVRIMTGAVLPAGADTVVMQEQARLVGAEVVLPAGQHCGQNVRRAGEDLHAGEIALARGKRLRPAELGLLASLGQAEIKVCRRLRVAIFSTGDELATLGQTLAAGQVYDSNRYTLHGMLSRLGCEVHDLGVVPDQPAALEAALQEAAAHADMIITSGGVSVGEADFIRELMAQLGEIAFWKINMKPGRPLAFGRIGACWLFGLPGNPVATMISFYQFVRPALLRLQGVPPADTVLPRLKMPTAVPLKQRPGICEFQRGILQLENGVYQVRPTGNQGSGILRSMSEAQVLIVLDGMRPQIAAGELVDIELLEGLV